MSRRVRLRAQAEQDIADAATWYEKARSGLGARFLDDVDELIGRISDAPEQFPVAVPGVRRGLLLRFPHSVYFEIGDDGIVIFAVLHSSRQPDIWKARR